MIAGVALAGVGAGLSVLVAQTAKGQRTRRNHTTAHFS
jgi:hypothetical protein